jgi:hypothetical protein
VALVLVLAVFTYPGAIAVSILTSLGSAPTASTPGPAGALPWLHVAHPASGRAYIADDRGRMVLLHGAIPAGLIDFWSGTDSKNLYPAPFYPMDPGAYANSCPANSAAYKYPPLCKSDLVAMMGMGFNSIRLPLSWSLLEPHRGQFSQTYLDRVAQVVDWARALGLYVIIDMHQNAYSRFVDRPSSPPLPGGKTVDLSSHSGAPAWATITDGFPSEDFLGHRELSPAVLEAFSNFWYNRDGIQDEYIATLAFLAKRFVDDPVVAGYSIFNEPLDGWNLPPGFGDLLLWPFYRRVIDALTGIHDGLPCWTGVFMPALCGYRDLGVHDLRHLFFLDTGLLREVTDFPTHLGMSVSSYPNLVLGIHAYTHIYTFDTFAGEPADKANYPWGGYEQGFAWADREAKAMNAALFVMEFGDSPEWDHEIARNVLLEAERHDVSFAFWTWKENGGPGSWGLFNPPAASSPTDSSGCLRTSRERLLAGAYPQASADPSPVFHYDAASGAFTLAAKGKAGDPPTVIVVPAEVTGTVSSSGPVQVSTTGAYQGGRVLTASPSGGAFTITVAPAPLALRGCA